MTLAPPRHGLLLAALVLAGCGEREVPARRALLEGRVLDDRGQPLANAAVRVVPVRPLWLAERFWRRQGRWSLDRVDATSGPDGRFVVAAGDATRCRLVAEVRGDRHEAPTHAPSLGAEVDPADGTRVELRVPRLATLHLRVLDAAGRPVHGAALRHSDPRTGDPLLAVGRRPPRILCRYVPDPTSRNGDFEPLWFAPGPVAFRVEGGAAVGSSDAPSPREGPLHLVSTPQRIDLAPGELRRVEVRVGPPAHLRCEPALDEAAGSSRSWWLVGPRSDPPLDSVGMQPEIDLANELWLAPGEYELLRRAGEPGMQTVAAHLTLRSGSTTALRLAELASTELVGIVVRDGALLGAGDAALLPLGAGGALPTAGGPCSVRARVADGHFTIGNLAAGRYVLAIVADDEHRIPWFDLCDIPAGALRVEHRCAFATGTVRWTVPEPGPAPATFAWARTLRLPTAEARFSYDACELCRRLGFATWWHFTARDPELVGRVRLPTGAYTFGLRGRGDTLSAAVHCSVVAGGTHDVALALGPAARVTIDLVAPNGAELPLRPRVRFLATSSLPPDPDDRDRELCMPPGWHTLELELDQLPLSRATLTTQLAAVPGRCKHTIVVRD